MICVLCNREGATARFKLDDEIVFVHIGCRNDYLKGPKPGHNED